MKNCQSKILAPIRYIIIVTIHATTTKNKNWMRHG